MLDKDKFAISCMVPVFPLLLVAAATPGEYVRAEDWIFLLVMYVLCAAGFYLFAPDGMWETLPARKEHYTQQNQTRPHKRQDKTRW